MVLAEEMHFYNKNEKRLAKWYPNSFVVIKGQQVYGGGAEYTGSILVRFGKI
jgi:hypothetical protein